MLEQCRLLPSGCFQLAGWRILCPPAIYSHISCIQFDVLCVFSNISVFSVQIHYTATHYSIKLKPEYNHTGNEWGQKPTVYVKDGLYTDHILRYELPRWLMQKEKGSAAHPLEAVMNKRLQTIVSVSAFVHSLLLMFPLVKKITISTLLSMGFSHPLNSPLLNRWDGSRDSLTACLEERKAVA